MRVAFGLTFEESEEVLAYIMAPDAASEEAGDRYLQLHDKHDRARFEVMGAEHMARDAVKH
jgi:hypothetical protein